MQVTEENKGQAGEGSSLREIPSNLDINIKKKTTTSTFDLAFDVDRLKIYYD